MPGADLHRNGLSIPIVWPPKRDLIFGSGGTHVSFLSIVG
jgi:hypothetical protein